MKGLENEVAGICVKYDVDVDFVQELTEALGRFFERQGRVLDGGADEVHTDKRLHPEGTGNQSLVERGEVYQGCVSEGDGRFRGGSPDCMQGDGFEGISKPAENTDRGVVQQKAAAVEKVADHKFPGKGLDGRYKGARWNRQWNRR